MSAIILVHFLDTWENQRKLHYVSRLQKETNGDQVLPVVILASEPPIPLCLII
jgi:hypothetical protein